MPLETNHEEFREIRARADSIANAVFLISGGALSISIGLLLDLKSKGEICPEIAQEIVLCWNYLLASVICFVLVKSHLVLQSFILQWATEFMNNHIKKSNFIGFSLGFGGVVAFIVGITKLVSVAGAIINA